MYQLRKEWEDGGRLTVTYEGRGDGDVTFESSANEGLDRETSVTFVDFSKDIRVECKVIQIGKLNCVIVGVTYLQLLRQMEALRYLCLLLIL